MQQAQSERGAALIGAVLIILILSMLGNVSMNVAAQEVESAAAARDEAVARHLAGAAADLVMQWFHDPSTAPEGISRGLFAMRQESSGGSPSFFDATGRSQFTGTEDRPDLLYDAARPTDDRLLNGPTDGWFHAFGALGRVKRLAVYGPTSPGLLCTLEVTAEARKLARTLIVQLEATPLPPVRAGAQLGANRLVQATSKPLPVSVHWGDLLVNGDASLGAVRGIPVKIDVAPVTEQVYAEMAHREDRWFDLFVGGEVLLASQPAGADQVPANVHVHQEPSPGLQLDRWDYQTLKDAAQRNGTYYARGQDGLLYRHGLIQPGLGVTAREAFQSGAVGDHRGLVFVDTLDRTPPREDNLGTLILGADYLEGVFVVNAHVHFAPTGEGKSVTAHSPPPDRRSTAEPRTPVTLTGIHLRGVLNTAGDLTLAGASRIYGAVIAGGTIEQASEAGAHIEIWYDDDLRAGLARGIPLISQAPGTWREKYGEKRT